MAFATPNAVVACHNRGRSCSLGNHCGSTDYDTLKCTVGVTASAVTEVLTLCRRITIPQSAGPNSPSASSPPVGAEAGASPEGTPRARNGEPSSACKKQHLFPSCRWVSKGRERPPFGRLGRSGGKSKSPRPPFLWGCKTPFPLAGQRKWGFEKRTFLKTRLRFRPSSRRPHLAARSKSPGCCRFRAPPLPPRPLRWVVSEYILAAFGVAKATGFC